MHTSQLYYILYPESLSSFFGQESFTSFFDFDLD